MRSENEPSKDMKVIICFTGMPGAGKSTAAAVAKDLGFDIVNMGEAVREETIKRGLTTTDENLGLVMLDLRCKQGMGAVANLVLPKISSSKKRIVAVDGVRNFEEIETFRNLGQVKILMIHASPETRFRFLQQRRRDDAPKSWKPFEARDEREISVGMMKTMALADEVISNNGISISELEEKTKKILSKWTDSIEH